MMAIIRKQNEKLREKISLLESKLIKKKNIGHDSPESKLLKFNIPDNEASNINSRKEISKRSLSKRSLSKSNISQKAKIDKDEISRRDLSRSKSRTDLRDKSQR
jgi:hypothetical protein